jgi:hypothetical protein
MINRLKKIGVNIRRLLHRRPRRPAPQYFSQAREYLLARHYVFASQHGITHKR